MPQRYVAFPKDTRALLAHLELEYERGEITEQEYASQETAAIEDARTRLGMFGVDATWRTDDNATERDYLYLPVAPPMVKTFVDGVPRMVPDAQPQRARPARRTMCFWIEVP